MFRNDADFIWRMKRLWIPAQAFQTYITGAGISSGTPVFIQIAAAGITAIAVDTDGDAIATLIPVPYDLDVEKHIYFRAMWTVGDTVSGDTFVWTLTFTTVNVGQPDIATTGGTVAGTTALIDPATALDTTIDVASGAAQEYGSSTADIINWTGYGSMDPRTLNPLNDALALKLTMTTETGNPTDTGLIGLEMSYTPRYLEGVDGMRAPAKRHQTILGAALQPDKVIR